MAYNSQNQNKEDTNNPFLINHFTFLTPFNLLNNNNNQNKPNLFNPFINPFLINHNLLQQGINSIKFSKSK